MKKLISLLAALAVVATGTVAFAAEDFTVETTTNGTTTSTPMTVVGDEDTADAIVKNETSGLYEVDLTSVATVTDATTNTTSIQDQTTILAVQGKAIAVGSIKYINQLADPSAFKFDMDDPTEKVYVLAGGSAISPTLVGIIAPKAAETEKITLTGKVSGNKGSKIPVVNVYKVVDTTETALTPVSAKDDNTFEITLDKPATGESYKIVVSETYYTDYTKQNITDNSSDIVATIAFGDIDDSGRVDLLEVTGSIAQFENAEGMEGYNAAYDADNTGRVDLTDVTGVIANFEKADLTE